MNSRVKIKRKGKTNRVTNCLYRVNSVKNLSSIAVALGAERARNELLPYILGKLKNNN